MEVPVIIEPVAGRGFRVTGAGGLSVGLTASEAIDRLAEQVRARLDSGVAPGPTDWKQDAGCLRDDPVFEPWREATEEYRRRLDQDPEAL